MERAKICRNLDTGTAVSFVTSDALVDLPRRLLGSRRAVLLPAIVGFCLSATGGCGPSARIADGTDPWASSVGQFARLAERYRVSHRGQMPATEDDLRRFAGSMDAAGLELIGIGNIDSCFVSDRDGQPLAMRLGQESGTGGDPSVVCYEREGRDGVRLVGKLGGDVEVADEARFAELVPAS
ncbi:MAG: hypothetical protein RLZZ440_2066 [Planctomycetota bacterium]